jgi:hypothetical protein
LRALHRVSAITATIVAVAMGASAPSAQESSTVLSAQALQEIAGLEAEIDRIEAKTIERLAAPRTIRFSRSSCSASSCCTTSSFP